MADNGESSVGNIASIVEGDEYPIEIEYIVENDSGDVDQHNDTSVDVEEKSIEDSTQDLKEQFQQYTKETESLKKYLALRKRCEQVQQTNEKLVNRIQHVKKTIKRYKQERKSLMSKLDELGDDLGDIQVPAVWEDDHVYRRLYPSAASHAAESHNDPTTSSIDKLSSLHPVISEVTHSRKVKVKQDPLAPKKPANAFLLFCQKRRSYVQEQYQKEYQRDIANYELTKRLAQQWNGLSTEDKAEYFEMYEKEKERYTRELKEYQSKETTHTTTKEDPTSQDTEVYRNLMAIRQEMGKEK